MKTLVAASVSAVVAAVLAVVVTVAVTRSDNGAPFDAEGTEEAVATLLQPIGELPESEVPETEPVTTVAASTTTATPAATTLLPTPSQQQDGLTEASAAEWTPREALAAVGDVCANAIDIENWTPRFWLLCDVVHGGIGAGDMWGFNAECVGDFLAGPDALKCIRDELVHFLSATTRPGN